MINAPASTPVRHLRAQGPRPSRTLKTVAFDDDENDNFGHHNDDDECQRQCQNSARISGFWIRSWFHNRRVRGCKPYQEIGDNGAQMMCGPALFISL